MYAHSLSSYYYYRTVMYKLCAYAFKYLLLSWIRFPVAALVFFFPLPAGLLLLVEWDEGSVVL